MTSPDPRCRSPRKPFTPGSRLQTFFPHLRATVHRQETTQIIDRAGYEHEIDTTIAHQTGQYAFFSTAAAGTCVGVPVLALRSVAPEIDCASGSCLPAASIPVVIEQVQRGYGAGFATSFPVVPVWLGCHRDGSSAPLVGCASDDRPLLLAFQTGQLTQTLTLAWDDPALASVPVRTELRQLGALYASRFGVWGAEQAWCGDAATASTSDQPGCELDADADLALGADCDDTTWYTNPSAVEGLGAADHDCNCYTFAGPGTLRVHRVGTNAPSGSGLASTCRGVP